MKRFFACILLVATLGSSTTKPATLFRRHGLKMAVAIPCVCSYAEQRLRKRDAQLDVTTINLSQTKPALGHLQNLATQMQNKIHLQPAEHIPVKTFTYPGHACLGLYHREEKTIYLKEDDLRYRPYGAQCGVILHELSHALDHTGIQSEGMTDLHAAYLLDCARCTHEFASLLIGVSDDPHGHMTHRDMQRVAEAFKQADKICPHHAQLPEYAWKAHAAALWLARDTSRTYHNLRLLTHDIIRPVYRALSAPLPRHLEQHFAPFNPSI